MQVERPRKLDRIGSKAMTSTLSQATADAISNNYSNNNSRSPVSQREKNKDRTMSRSEPSSSLIYIDSSSDDNNESQQKPSERRPVAKSNRRGSRSDGSGHNNSTNSSRSSSSLGFNTNGQSQLTRVPDVAVASPNDARSATERDLFSAAEGTRASPVRSSSSSASFPSPSSTAVPQRSTYHQQRQSPQRHHSHHRSSGEQASERSLGSESSRVTTPVTITASVHAPPSSSPPPSLAHAGSTASSRASKNIAAASERDHLDRSDERHSTSKQSGSRGVTRDSTEARISETPTSSRQQQRHESVAPDCIVVDSDKEQDQGTEEVLITQHRGYRHPAVTLLDTSVASPHRLDPRQLFAGDRMAHTRNFSSPSLLDSFTSPEPMLSPIQSYFGSDPNSPASSFSLPRHDQYLEAPGPAASMDGYHGFATHPWSEQSTMPSRALSHRWTRRLSHPESLPSRNRPNERMVSDNGTQPHRASMYAGPSLAEVMMNQNWQEARVAPDSTTGLTSTTDDASACAESSTAEYIQDSDDDTAMEEPYETTYDQHYDYNHNLRNSDAEDEIDDDECYPYSFQAASLDDHDQEQGEEEDCEEIGTPHVAPLDEDELNQSHVTDDMLDALDYEQGQNGGFPRGLNDGEDENDDYATEEESEVAQILGFGRRQNESAFSTLHSPTDVNEASTSSASPSQAVFSSHNTLGRQEESLVESDESLARRLQEEEFSALIGDRSFHLHRNLVAQHQPPSLPRRFSDRQRSHPVTHSTGYSTRGRLHFATETTPSGESRHFLPGEWPSNWRQRDGYLPGEWPSSWRQREGQSSGQSSRSLGSGTVNPVAPLTSSSASGRHGRVRRSRSPPGHSTSSSLAAEGLFLRHELRTLTRALEQETRILARYNSRSNPLMDSMWGNPEDYLNDDQVDDSYEGLLRLGEQIGDAKPKGIPMHTLRKMDKHIFVWTPKRHSWSSKGLRHSRSQSLLSFDSDYFGASNPSKGKAKDASASESLDENCTICLDAYQTTDRLRPLPCKHAFHVECIDTWLRSNAQCPICRQEVSAKSVESMPAGSGIP
ncbi:hypothetical protein EMPS_01823 [Entomortierella parvispora]|uniref:RING-type domain-containing protein n=1 Tax=Entomortierella parvispora TaxID=205924 RepID=A0A9P3H3P5_9FUNG|nr:hypothetical protein EMPS_01823 [Entomortierella parvispora]